MIEKILDNYYANKLVDNIKSILPIYNLDFKYMFEKDSILIQCKKRKFKDSEYCEIIRLEKKDCFRYLINFDNLERRIKIAIDYYLEEEN